MSDFTLAALNDQDLVRCAELEQELFAGDDPWSEKAFRAEIAQGNYYIGAYDVEGKLIGYAGLALLGNGTDLESEIHTIAVDPPWQGRGVGKALLLALLDKADEHNAEVFLEVRTDNAPALALYEKHGFSRIGLRRRYYYPSGADAYTMRRPALAGALDQEGKR